MFAHCLLPVLLLVLLAAVDAKPSALAALADPIDPPYPTVIDKGDLNVPLGKTKLYYIPGKQCGGAISQIKEQPELHCTYGHVVRVQVIVLDYAPGTQGYISDDLDSATITRATPCAGDAKVQVRVGCGPYLSPLPLPLV